jgi:N-acetylglucosaminyldiphosphoundecaprenol N-acetyl-beta-D-mannosaminyltransferase
MASPSHDVSILGVRITNATRRHAIDLFESLIRSGDRRAHAIFIVNAHTLNLASSDPGYRRLLNDGFRVFADGTGARWAARVRGVRLQDNLVGTDLVPELFESTAGRGYRYFLLGADRATIVSAARACTRTFPGWDLAGFHDGFVDPQRTEQLLQQINASHPDLLLVGMGNPLQECWIHQYRSRLQVPVVMGVGGLFGYWSGDLQRAPSWVRRAGMEWLRILIGQPHKWRRYLLGNPLFLYRMLRDLPRERVSRA